jgi:methyl-accepting chemotaxis protein
MKSLIIRLLNASVATKLIGFAATLLIVTITLESFVVVSMQKRTAVHEALLFADGIEKVALSGLTTMMITGQMQQRELLLDQINESGIVRDLRIIRGKKVVAVYGEGRSSEKVNYPFEAEVLETGSPYVSEEPGDTLRIVKPIRAQANYLGKNCLGCHQAQPNEILGAITMQISLSEVAQKSRQFSLQIFGAGIVLTVILVGGLFLLSRVIITQPLDKLLKLFQRLQQRDYTVKIAPHSRDEVGRLTEGAATFLAYTVEVLTKLGKISAQLSTLAEKTRETSEKFLDLSERQSGAIEETSAAVSELNHSLQSEKAELAQFLELAGRIAEYAERAHAVGDSAAAENAKFREMTERNTRKLKRGYKILLDSLAQAEQHFTTHAKDLQNMSGETLPLHKLIVDLSGARLVLKDALVSHLKATEEILRALSRTVALGEEGSLNDSETRRLSDLRQKLLAEFQAQAEASDEIRNTVNLLSSEAAGIAAAAGDLSQMANEASRMAQLVKDLLNEFKLPG